MGHLKYSAGEHQVCQDCLSPLLSCHACLLQSHLRMSFHRIEEWQDGFFHAVTLKSLGLHIQLSHKAGETCCHPSPAFHDDFIVIDTHGIHEVGLYFCGCEHEASHYKQLLQARLFPATATDPRTAATFAVLKFFHLLSFESKVSAYKFYHSLAHQSDNTGITPIRDHYSTFLRIVHEWRNLRSLKCAGHGHDPAGVNATQEGELALLCLACPHPGKIYLTGGKLQLNRLMLTYFRWMYSVFLAINANFHLKHRAISSDTKDPGLSGGWGYFINEKPYKAYIGNSSAVIQECQQRSTCVSHNAVNMADTKISKGLAATGVGTVDCACHDMKLVNGVGDLQKGERYVNMDYLVSSALSTFSSLKVINFSYDIACQWHKKLWGHVPSLPHRLQPDPVGKTFRYFVPKFHLAVHIKACQMMFSLNWSPSVGRTDGEAPEHGWANINCVAMSTKEMGPGACRDALDDHFRDWNWKKITSLVLLQKVIKAVRAEQEHCIALSELEDSIQESELGTSSLAKWREEIETWEVDHTKPNPFERHIDTMTQAAVWLELAKQDAKELEDGTAVSLHSEVSCSILISTSMDLEHAQRQLRADAGLLSQHPTDTQRTSILTRSNALLRCIDTWTMIQTLYMPLIDLSSDNDDDSGCPKPNPNSGKAEDSQLLLPSEICDHVPCDRKLLEIEWSLRLAQAHDALNECRTHIRLRQQLVQFKKHHIRGQNPNTRARNTLDTVEHRLALVTLSNHLDCPLTRSHLRQSQGRTIMSWIWLTQGISNDDAESLQDMLRVEWCKARAHQNCWSEEMRRVLAFFNWQVQWWEDRISLQTLARLEETKGLIAYAKRQAFIRRRLSASFRENAEYLRSTQRFMVIVDGGGQILTSPGAASDAHRAQPPMDNCTGTMYLRMDS
ncbi:uncharacterized protein F5891DRAFT_1128056 [Suillus fuscotomentosus]|uniref:CxC2-like cysteine cluster KDZ transposase-associated domain-containing protein n=1 Tax=Suillus fuscotomentosus TaxID=1912939 RepID=A0AAD4E8P3_9AGAM|nr:uncharacterized protein F5891DRAFT_1128056 [Suillus fuscotomentosus]KAG1901642.1 hypothetical protein F5891DRAFT_1128056 [Suillus fuscotomentosus]